MHDFLPYSKAQQTQSKRVKLTQREKGDISTKVDKQLKARSHGLCELCDNALATERAHLIGRKHINHKTRVTDLLHLCTACHDWLDETPEGIRARRAMAMLVKSAKE
ncbi:hypothetical protein [Paenibacillus sp. 1-18]|uniref:hypothetical protein n=1 Tax=Paenibacillus sp. 1-18 TaxID=1333846 RepID=UPI000471A5DF|nr:hypothetical protein [Paenibacillus sp. 1-18]